MGEQGFVCYGIKIIKWTGCKDYRIIFYGPRMTRARSKQIWTDRVKKDMVTIILIQEITLTELNGENGVM